MNTTMADGARERCVAQIGEALFGQPGLTLMELAEKVKASQPTPSSRWAAMGEPDPHGSRYDCERAALVMGNLTDDELANAVFLHGNEQPTMAQLAAGAMLPIAYLTAAKDRIRWLSRALVEAQPKSAAQPEQAVALGAEPMFYIQDTRQFVGNCPMWWGPHGSGYVTRLDEAGRYTEEEAIRQNRTRETDIPWPCSEIDALARQTVDCQHMRPRAERLAELALIDSKAVG
ncbi:MAG TPA: hypothetical protein DCP40_06090 [Stenotrophomonas sp.]|nr:hypothetical protein [Stenotrophomonas sp.]